jgi:chromosomal replication initiator protein
MYFIRLLNDHTLEEVGNVLGGRDHTTVSYSCEKIIKKMMDNEEFRQTIDVIRKKLER